MTARKGKKCPQFALQFGAGQYTYVNHDGMPLSAGKAVRLLNAGERAKAEVKRLKAELAQLGWHFRMQHEVVGEGTESSWWCMQCREGPQR